MSRNLIHSAVLSVVLVSLSARSGSAESVSPQILESLIKGQPNHAADYTLTEPDGRSRVMRYAARDGSSFIGAVPSDTLSTPYVVRTAAGKAYAVNPKVRLYTEISNPLFLFDPPLQTLETSARLNNGTVTAEDKGSGTFAGHPIQRFVVKFKFEEMKREVTVLAAKDLRLLLLNLEMRGGYTGGFSITLSNVSLDPPASMFLVPAGYKEVDEETFAKAVPDTSPRAAASPAVLDTLITGQPDHEADYTYTMIADGSTMVVHNAMRGHWKYRAMTADGPKGPQPEVLVRNPEGKVFSLDAKRRTYSEVSEPEESFMLPLKSFEKVTLASGGTITVEDQGPGTFAGHPTETFVIRFGAQDGGVEVTVLAAKDLGMLVLSLVKSGGGLPFSYRLSNVKLDPPESLFAIPADYKRVSEN